MFERKKYTKTANLGLLTVVCTAFAFFQNAYGLDGQNSDPEASIIMEGAFTFDDDEGLTGRLLEGQMAQTAMRSPNTMFTLGKPSRSMYGETLEITFSYDSPPMDTGTYQLVALQDYRDMDDTENAVVTSVRFQEEGAHPRDTVRFEQGVTGDLILELGDGYVSGEFTFQISNAEDEEIELEGEFSNIPVVELD